MDNLEDMPDDFNDNGFAVVNGIYNPDEIAGMINIIGTADQSNATFRKTDDLFAIRQFIREIPEVQQFIFNDKLINLINSLFGEAYFVVKSIYFDKPEKSNWFVSWHQDLTISVDKKIELDGYGPWTTKQNQFAVQPPVDILKDNFTVRMHLDDTDENNDALKVISGSHLKGIVRTNEMDYSKEEVVSCNVQAGGVMIMRPLLIHSSNRTTSNKQRRVVHIEFSRIELPKAISWAERDSLYREGS